MFATLGRGGAERRGTWLAREMKRRGHDVHVSTLVAPKLGESTYAPDIEAAGIPLHDLGHAGARNFGAWPRTFRALWRSAVLLRTLKPDAVLAVLPSCAAVCGVTLPIGGRTKLVVCREGLPTYRKGRPVLATMEDLADQRAASTLCVSSGIARALDELDGGRSWRRVDVINNGIETELWPITSDAARLSSRKKWSDTLGETLAPEHRVVIQAANLIPYKGHLDVIDALAQLEQSAAPEIEHLRVIFVGGDPKKHRAVLHKAASEAGLLDGHGPRVIFAGLIEPERMPSLLETGDAFLQASYEEGLSLALLEGLSTGIPAIATTVGGTLDALDPRYDWPIPPRDPEAIARSLSEVASISLKELRARGQKGAERVRVHFSAKQMADATEVLLKGITRANQQH